MQTRFPLLRRFMGAGADQFAFHLYTIKETISSFNYTVWFERRYSRNLWLFGTLAYFPSLLVIMYRFFLFPEIRYNEVLLYFNTDQIALLQVEHCKSFVPSLKVRVSKSCHVYRIIRCLVLHVKCIRLSCCTAILVVLSIETQASKLLGKLTLILQCDMKSIMYCHELMDGQLISLLGRNSMLRGF